MENVVAAAVAMLGVYVFKLVGLTGPAILLGAVALIACTITGSSVMAVAGLADRRPMTGCAASSCSRDRPRAPRALVGSPDALRGLSKRS